MKKTIKMLCVAAIALFAIPQHADAQFFKKLGEAAVDAAAEVVKETIVGETPDNASNVNIETSASGVASATPEHSISTWNSLKPSATRRAIPLRFT